jgi:hypothetical protein
MYETSMLDMSLIFRQITEPMQKQRKIPLLPVFSAVLSTALVESLALDYPSVALQPSGESRKHA